MRSSVISSVNIKEKPNISIDLLTQYNGLSNPLYRIHFLHSLQR